MMRAQHNPGADDGGMAGRTGSSLGEGSTSQAMMDQNGALLPNLGGISDIMDNSVEHLNTFEKLNDQIQQSIASLKKMSDQRADKQLNSNQENSSMQYSTQALPKSTKKRPIAGNPSVSSLSRSFKGPAQAQPSRSSNSLSKAPASHTPKDKSGKKKTTPKIRKPDNDIVTPSQIVIRTSSGGRGSSGGGARRGGSADAGSGPRKAPSRLSKQEKAVKG